MKSADIIGNSLWRTWVLSFDLRPHWILIVAFVTLGRGVAVCAATGQAPLGRITGTVIEIMGNRTKPATGVKVSVWTQGDERTEYNAMTDQKGKYTVYLPAGNYGMHLHWFGECSTISRAGFNLTGGEHLTFDFLVVPCPVIDTVKEEAIPLEGAAAKGSITNQKAEADPLSEPKYQEQLIPSEKRRWPEIVISFGKYEDRGAEIRYLALPSMKVLNRTSNPPVVPMSLPVTVTVDQYTVRALDVVLNKNTMVFKAKGEVSVSDGRHKSTGASATISFSDGLPKVQITR